MVRHIVLIKFLPTFGDTEIAALFSELVEIKAEIPSVLSITSGRSESPEKIERGYMHGFVIDFSDWEGLEAYQQHPDHQKLGAKLVANAVGGKKGILVFDLPVAEPNKTIP